MKRKRDWEFKGYGYFSHHFPVGGSIVPCLQLSEIWQRHAHGYIHWPLRANPSKAAPEGPSNASGSAWLAGYEEGLLKQLERRQQAATACIQGLNSVLISSLYPNSVVW